MLLKLLATLIICGLISLTLWWMKVQLFWAIRKVPHIKPFPLIGNLDFIMTQNTSMWLREIYNKYQGFPYIGAWFLWKPIVLINCPKLARRILVKDFDIFRNRFMGGGKRDIIGSMNLVMVKEPYWSPIRRSLSPVFTLSKLRKHQRIMCITANTLAERIKLDVNKDKIIELRDLFSDFSTDVVSLVLFGVESNAMLGGKSPLRDATRDFIKFDKSRALDWSLLVLFPFLAKVFGLTFFPKSCMHYLKQSINKVTNQRKEHLRSCSPDNLFDALLKLKQEGILNKEEEDDEVLIAQAVVFLEAGFESIALTLTHTMHELAFSPQVQSNLYKELSDNTINDVNHDVLPDLTYLNCVIKESLRKCPPLGWLDRVASKEYWLDKDLIIPAGTPVYINVAGIQSDGNFYPDPNKFNPDRFLPNNKKDNFELFAFGDGPRNCIGYKFAWEVIYYATAVIVKNFIILPTSNLETGERCFEKRSLVLSPSESNTVQFVPRNC